jgi:hypothetical protein
MDLDEIKALFQIEVLETHYGSEVVHLGACSESFRHKQLYEDKDVFYVKLQMTNKGKDPHLFSFKHFLLSDSDGYFNDPHKASDYFQSYAAPQEQLQGGLLFSIYTDVTPVDLWFNSGHLYEDSLDAILIKISMENKTDKGTSGNITTTSLHKSNPTRVCKKLLESIIEDYRIPYKKLKEGYLLRIQCPNYRRQFVLVTFEEKDDQGDEVVTLSTVCAPVSSTPETEAFLFLRLNSRLFYAAVAIQEIKGEEYYVIILKLLAATCDKMEMVKGIRAVSRQGDWLETELTGGKDLQ